MAQLFSILKKWANISGRLQYSLRHVEKIFFKIQFEVSRKLHVSGKNTPSRNAEFYAYFKMQKITKKVVAEKTPFRIQNR
jgi:hypothetical protein